MSSLFTSLWNYSPSCNNNSANNTNQSNFPVKIDNEFHIYFPTHFHFRRPSAAKWSIDNIKNSTEFPFRSIIDHLDAIFHPSQSEVSTKPTFPSEQKTLLKTTLSTKINCTRGISHGIRKILCCIATVLQHVDAYLELCVSAAPSTVDYPRNIGLWQRDDCAGWKCGLI